MNAAEIIVRLKLMEPELRAAGLDALYLFGSRARGDHRADSDVDLLYEAATDDLDYFRLFGLRENVSARLHLPVDLVQRQNLHAIVIPFVEPDLLRVF